MNVWNFYKKVSQVCWTNAAEILVKSQNEIHVVLNESSNYNVQARCHLFPQMYEKNRKIVDIKDEKDVFVPSPSKTPM